MLHTIRETIVHTISSLKIFMFMGFQESSTSLQEKHSQKFFIDYTQTENFAKAVLEIVKVVYVNSSIRKSTNVINLLDCVKSCR